MYEQVLEFHKAFGLEIDAKPSIGLLQLRDSLIAEESIEVSDELADLTDRIKSDYGRDISQVKARLTKELVDLVYVAIGTAVSLGLPFEKAFDEVHRSNMSKLDKDGNPVYREDGKVLKSDQYSPADIGKLM